MKTRLTAKVVIGEDHRLENIPSASKLVGSVDGALKFWKLMGHGDLLGPSKHDHPFAIVNGR